jgi:hypothetical protein
MAGQTIVSHLDADNQKHWSFERQAVRRAPRVTRERSALAVSGRLPAMDPGAAREDSRSTR